MPRYNIWIREADDEKWKAITDKPQFISDAINVLDREKQNRKIQSDFSKKYEKQGGYQIPAPNFSFDDPTYTDPEEAA